MATQVSGNVYYIRAKSDVSRDSFLRYFDSHCGTHTLKQVESACCACITLYRPFATQAVFLFAQINTDEAKDWFTAISGYYTWSRAKVTKAASNKFDMELEYHMRDWYNFNNPKFAPNVLPLWGYAQDYESIGTVKVAISWRIGERLLWGKSTPPTFQFVVGVDDFA